MLRNNHKKVKALNLANKIPDGLNSVCVLPVACICVVSRPVSTCVSEPNWGQGKEEVALSSRYLKPEWVRNTGTLRPKQISKQTLTM